MYRHESFWVVAGTAAPVIAVALAVVSADVIKTPLPPKGSKARKHLRWCYGVASGGFFAMILLLMFALFNLDRGRDSLGTYWGETLAVLGLISVFWASLEAVRSRRAAAAEAKRAAASSVAR